MFSTIQKQQICLLFFVQVVLIVLMGTLMTYGPEANANLLKNLTGQCACETTPLNYGTTWIISARRPTFVIVKYSYGPMSRHFGNYTLSGVE